MPTKLGCDAGQVIRFARLALPLVGAPLIAAAPLPIGSMPQTLASIDAILAREHDDVIDARPDFHWLDGKRLLFRSDSDRLDVDLIVLAPAPQRNRIADDAWLRPALVAAGAPAAVTLDAFSSDARHLVVLGDGTVYQVDLATRTATRDDAASKQLALARQRQISDQFPTTFGPMVEAASPDGRYFVGRANDNVYVRGAGSDERRFVTNDGAPRLSWLDTEESAQTLNALWSPDGRLIAAARLDSRDVAHEPVLRWLTRAPTVDWLAYPRAGDQIHRFDLAVINAVTGARVAIKTGNTADHYVNLLGWLADSRRLLYQVVDREQKSFKIYRADATSGNARLILSEKRSTYIDTPMTLAPTLVHPLPGGGFLYLSEADGRRHIYRYDDNGRLIRRLTQGAWPVEDIVRITAAWVYFRAVRDVNYEASLYRVPLTGGKAAPVAAGGNISDVAFAPDGQHLVIVRGTPTSAPVAELRSADGRLVSTLATGVLSPALPQIDRVTTPSQDGRFIMHGFVLRPKNFDPTLRYPVVEIIYGGMQLDFLPRDAYATGWWRSGYNARMGRLLANLGNVVVYMNAPGTPGRGRAFQDATYGIWPQTVIENHARFIRVAAASRPWMDLDRVGIFGNSWGGYLAQRALIDAPDLYKAAVAMAAPSDFVDHPTYIEPFMGLPRNNPEGYAMGSNLAMLGKIKGSVLVMPEPLDVNAGFSPAMKFVDGMIAVGGDVELFTMPEVNHRVNCCGWSRERYAYAVALRFLERKLGAGAEGAH